MNSTQPTSGQGSSTEKSELARQLHSTARAIFIIWIGIAMLLAISWGWFLVGLGILILAAQLAHSQMNIKIEGSWVAWGALFLVGGLWTVLNITSRRGGDFRGGSSGSASARAVAGCRCAAAID